MKEKLISVAKSPAVRKAAVVFVLAILTALGFNLQGCAGQPLSPQVAAALEVFDCQLDAAKGLVPSVVIAEEVVNAARSKNYEYAVRTMLALGMSTDEIMKVAEAVEACTAPEPVPAPDAAPAPAPIKA